MIGEEIQCSQSYLTISNNETEEKFSEGLLFCSSSPDIVGQVIHSRNEFMFLKLGVGVQTEVDIKLEYYGLSKEKGSSREEGAV